MFICMQKIGFITVIGFAILFFFLFGCSKSNKDNNVVVQPENESMEKKIPFRSSDSIERKYALLDPPGTEKNKPYFSKSRLMHSRLNFVGNQIRHFRAKHGRYPDSMEDFLNSNTTIFWPVDPFSQKPFSFTETINANIDSMGKFTFDYVGDELTILCAIPVEEVEFRLANYPYPKPGYDPDKMQEYYKNQFSTLPNVFNSDAYLLVGRYVKQFNRLPETFTEFLWGYKIIKDNWPDMNSVSSKKDEGYFELGLSGDKMTYYGIVRETTGLLRSEGWPYNRTSETDDQLIALDWFSGAEVTELLDRVPFASSMIYPTVDSLPEELVISKADILALE